MNKKGFPLTEKIRERANEIVNASVDLLRINQKKVSGLRVLVDNFLRTKRPYVNDFVGLGQDLDWQLGLNLFFDVVNFCFKDPSSGDEYQYKSQSKGIIKRSLGLFHALAESGINWNDNENVSDISEQDWTRTTQISTNNHLYLGAERGKRLSDFAKYLLDKEFKTVTDFLRTGFSKGLKWPSVS